MTTPRKRGRPKKETKESVESVESTPESVDTAIPPPTENDKQETDTAIDSDFVGTEGSFNPFAENVIEREYATPKVADGIVGDIEEPNFKPPTYDQILSGEADEPDGNTSPFHEPNEAFNELDERDKQLACESLVDTVLDVYAQLHSVGIMATQVNMEDLSLEEMKGKIDMSMPVPTENGTMPLGQFVQLYNSQCKTALEYDEEFGRKVRPKMIRIFAKKGWGMTDGQFLAFQFGKDAVTKIGLMYSMKKNMNLTLDYLRVQHKESLEGGYQPTYESEPTPEPDYQPNVEIVDDVPKQPKTTDSFDINFPQNPTDPLSEHPKEVKTEIKKGKK